MALRCHLPTQMSDTLAKPGRQPPQRKSALTTKWEMHECGQNSLQTRSVVDNDENENINHTIILLSPSTSPLTLLRLRIARLHITLTRHTTRQLQLFRTCNLWSVLCICSHMIPVPSAHTFVASLFVGNSTSLFGHIVARIGCNISTSKSHQIGS